MTGVQFESVFPLSRRGRNLWRNQANLVDAAGGNPLGLDPSDPHSHDDIVTSVLELPVHQQANIRLRAQDVIHGFFVPGMRVMQNATPGMPSQIHITPTRIGDYAIVCSQLCGLGHYRMHAILRVVSQQDFAAWMAQHQAASKEN